MEHRYSAILARMNVPGGTVAGVINGSTARQSVSLCAIVKKAFDRARDRAITFTATNAYNDTKRMTVDIYNLNGARVKELVSNGAVVRWDMTSAGHFPVAIGGYAYSIRLECARKTTEESGTFQIVR